MKQYSFYDLKTGHFLQGYKTLGSESQLRDNTPDGFGAMEGVWDSLSQKLDHATGLVVDWRPVAPVDDAWLTWTWDEVVRRWISTPTDASTYMDKQAVIKAEMTRLEATQARPMRELMIDPTNTTERLKLEQIDLQLEALRFSLTDPERS